MKLVNSRGRVLLEVYDARTIGADVFYSWHGPGLGGYGPLVQLHRAIETVKADAPSTRVIGLLPQTDKAPGGAR